MTIIRYKDGQNEIFNEAGRQALGSTSAGKEGLNPKELLEASLGLCVSINLIEVLKEEGIALPADGIDIKITASKAPGVTSHFTDFDVTVDFPDLPPEDKQRAIAIIEEDCTIGNTLRNLPKIVVRDSKE